MDNSASSGAWAKFNADHPSDTWSEKEGVNVVKFTIDNEALMYTQSVDDEFLFDLTQDESELNNLLNPDLPRFDQAKNDEVHSL